MGQSTVGNILSTSASQDLAERAYKVLPEGVSSNGRLFEPHPIYFQRGLGSRIWDVDGNEYLDLLMGMGPLIFGHVPQKIIQSVKEQLNKGTLFAAESPLTIEVAEKISRSVPNADMVRFANSGTEAVMHAIRLARGVTGRSKIIKFEGNYHGTSDPVLVNYVIPTDPSTGSPIEDGPLPSRYPASWGITKGTLEDIIPVPWNDEHAIKTVIRRHGKEIAAVLTEPIMLNAGCCLPRENYLHMLRELTEQNDILLILDEVKTGFRLALGGAQQYFRVNADIICMAKALGAGFPVAAFAGRREIMEKIGEGKVAHYGTYSANPVSLAAANAVLDELIENGHIIYSTLHGRGEQLADGLRDSIESLGTKAIVQGIGAAGIILLHTTQPKVENSRQFQKCDHQKNLKFQRELLKRGVFTMPGDQFFVSTAHGKADIEEAISAARDSLQIVG
jgi:glutamate-1-semialdehyde 2,1-aminomutase